MSHFDSIRSQWTLNHIPYSESTHSHSTIPVDQYDGIYDCLISGKSLKKPLNLSFIIAVLIHGWKSDGLFTPPPGYITGNKSSE
jgi:hypothetical protein